MSIEGTAGDIHIIYDRECPGKDLANRSLFIAAVTMLWAFDMSAPSDIDGRPLLPSSENFVDEGLVV